MRVATASPADWSGFSPYQAVQIIYLCKILGIKLPEIVKKDASNCYRPNGTYCFGQCFLELQMFVG